ncbi:MAG: efflux RND transporter periplasmic adaptor subunit [Pseudomonadota bacterium]
MNTNNNNYTALGRILSIVLPVCLILAGVVGYRYFKSNEAKMNRKSPKQQAVMVETIAMKPGNYQSFVRAMGTVVSDKQIVLKSKVAGEVVSISSKFLQGGLIRKGEILLTIDDADYQIEVKKALSALNKVLSDLKIEQGSQMIAIEELKLINQADLGDVKATDLNLRKPQLAQAKAAVDSAMADLERARLNLSRTKVIVPFNALVLEKSVNLGSLVTSQGVLATLVDVDFYQVEAQVPPDMLSVLKISETSGSKAIVHSQYSNQTWQGKVARITGKMSANSRMAGVIVLIADPLGLKKDNHPGQLLLSDHVELKMMGETLENVFLLSRSFLRDENTVWIYNNGVLEIKSVDLAWKEDGLVYIRSGINAGDLLIVSDLPAPVKGMALQMVPGDRS